MRPPGVFTLAPGIALAHLPIALLLLALLGTVLFAVRVRRVSRTAAARATILDLAVTAWLALTLLVTVVPMGLTDSPPIGFIPFLDAFDRIANGFSSPASEATDLVLNVLLFMPFGAWAALRFGRSWMIATIVGGAILSIGIEVSQALEAVGRSASTTDVLTNTIGTGIGFLVGLRIGHANERPDR
jgi:glycopeptide antibiotics resistance protein